MSVIEPKKMVGRGIVLALGLVCIVLIAWLAGTVAYYTSILNDRDNTIVTLESNIRNLQNQVGNFSNIVDLNYSNVIADNQTVTGDENRYFSWMFDASNCGYVSVTIHDSTDNPTEVIVGYVNFGNEHPTDISILTNTTASFPILATQINWCTVGVNIHFKTTYNSARVTVIYYY